LWLLSTLIGIVIFGILILTVLYGPHELQNRINQALHGDLPTLQSAIETYYEEKGIYPDRLKDLVSGQNGRRYAEQIPSDPWQKSYVYRVMDDGYQLYSIGKNGVDESELGDDITSFEKDYSCADYGLNCPYTKKQYTVIIAAIITAVIWIISGVLVFVFTALGLLAYFSRTSQKHNNSTVNQSAYIDHNRKPQISKAGKWAGKEVDISELPRLPGGYRKRERNGITKISWRLNMNWLERTKSYFVLLVCLFFIWAIITDEASWESIVDAELSPWEVLANNMWSFEWWRTMFPLPLLPIIIGSVIVYAQLGLLVNRSTLKIAQKSIKFTTGPIPWLARGSLELSDIIHFYKEDVVGKNTGSSVLVAKLHNNKNSKLVRLRFKDETSHGIDFLVKESNAALGK